MNQLFRSSVEKNLMDDYYRLTKEHEQMTKDVIADLSNGKEDVLWRTIDYIKEINTDNFAYNMMNFMWRSKWTDSIGWSLPSKEAICSIKEICGDSVLLSIGSGLGLWEFLMSNAKINVIATDIKIPIRTFFTKEKYEEHEAKTAIVLHPEANVLFVNWPYTFAEEALHLFKGKFVVNIGEGVGGCTGNIREILDNEDGEWSVYNVVRIPRWYGVYDNLKIYERK
jgi:hypothetical protein